MTSERTKAMDDLIAQDADLIDKLRDTDSYYRIQEKHWCIDHEELERQRLAAADRIEALETQLESANEALRERLDICETQAREIERLREALEPFTFRDDGDDEIVFRQHPSIIVRCEATYGDIQLARAALAGDSHD